MATKVYIVLTEECYATYKSEIAAFRTMESAEKYIESAVNNTDELSVRTDIEEYEISLVGDVVFIVTSEGWFGECERCDFAPTLFPTRAEAKAFLHAIGRTEQDSDDEDYEVSEAVQKGKCLCHMIILESVVRD